MGCSLRAILLEQAARERVPAGVPLAELERGLLLIPVTDKVHDGLPHTRWWFEDAFTHLSDGVHDLAVALTVPSGVAAYVEAEFFGGAGGQAAVVWRDGILLSGPHRRTTADPDRTEPWPINAALAQLGVLAGPGTDAFGAEGLDRHRDTDDWRLRAE